MAVETKNYGRAKLVAGQGGPGNIGSGVSELGLSPFFCKQENGRTEVFVPFADAAGFARLAAGDAETLEAAGKTLLAAARFAAGSADTES